LVTCFIGWTRPTCIIASLILERYKDLNFWLFESFFLGFIYICILGLCGIYALFLFLNKYWVFDLLWV
jgi:hypothetical protein